ITSTGESDACPRRLPRDSGSAALSLRQGMTTDRPGGSLTVAVPAPTHRVYSLPVARGGRWTDRQRTPTARHNGRRLPSPFFPSPPRLAARTDRRRCGRPPRAARRRAPRIADEAPAALRTPARGGSGGGGRRLPLRLPADLRHPR